VAEEYVEHIGALQPDKKVKHGDRYENWKETGDDHYFDCEKMWLVLFDYARDALPADQWRVAVPFSRRRQKRPRRAKVEISIP